MIEKPKQYFDTRSHQLYYQWDESEYFSHQEPIYDRTREYIESLEAENAKLWELASLVSEYISHDRCEGCVTKQVGRTEETMDIIPLIDRCKALVDTKVKALEDKISELSFHEDMGR